MTGELAASAALAGGEDVVQVLDGIAEMVREAGRDHHATLLTVVLPAAGNA